MQLCPHVSRAGAYSSDTESRAANERAGMRGWGSGTYLFREDVPGTWISQVEPAIEHAGLVTHAAASAFQNFLGTARKARQIRSDDVDDGHTGDARASTRPTPTQTPPPDKPSQLTRQRSPTHRDETSAGTKRIKPNAPAATSKMGGIQRVVDACSHLQNASRARLALTSVPPSTYNVRLALALHRAGYVSSIIRGGPHPPDPEAPAEALEPLTWANVARSRLWIGLKYWDGRPVMQTIKPVSTPKRKITMQLPALERIVRGLPSKAFPGLTLGESLFLTTDVGVLEAREALERHRGGLLLCRVS